jgi:hypothetical protein
MISTHTKDFSGKKGQVEIRQISILFLIAGFLQQVLTGSHI